MNDNAIIKENKVNSAEIIEYAKQKIDALNEEYKGAAPGEFDTDVFNKMTEIINNLIKAAVKLEALDILAGLPNCDDDANKAIAHAINGMMNHYH